MKQPDRIYYSVNDRADRQYQPEQAYIVEINKNGFRIIEEDAGGQTWTRVSLPIEFIKDFTGNADKKEYMQMELDLARAEQSLFISTREFVQRVESLKSRCQESIDTMTKELLELRAWKKDRQALDEKHLNKFKNLQLD